MGGGGGAGKFSGSAVLWVEEVEKKVSAGASGCGSSRNDYFPMTDPKAC
jgi:hypothetical protein